MLSGRKKKFKITILLLINILMITGCDMNQENNYGLDKKNPVAIKIWHYYNGSQKIEFDNMVEEFNKTVGKDKGIIVEAFNQGSVNELADKILDTANKKVGTGTMPDTFMAYPDTAYEIEKLGLLSDFKQYLTESEVNEYVDAYIDEGKLSDEDKLNIFPIAKATEILIVNKTDWDKFAKETNADIKEFETWEGIAKLAKQYYEWTDSKTELMNDGKAFFGRDAMANYMLIGSEQLGKEMFKVEDGHVTVNINEQVMKRLWDNFYIPYINGYYAAYGRFRSDDAKTGDIIALVGSTAVAEYFPESVITNDEKSYKIESMVLPLPKFKDGKGYAPQQGAGMAITKSDTKHEFAVTEFLKWFTYPDRNIEFSIKSGYLPVKKQANNIELIKNKFKENKDLDIPKSSQDVILTAMSEAENQVFYSSKAFYGADKARGILEKTMINKAKVDRKEIKIELDKGISKEEVIKKYYSDENFKMWLEELKNEISKVT